MRRVRYVTALLAFITWSLPAIAQEFPSRRLSLVVPFPAGSGIDLTARVVADKLAGQLGQPVIVENKAGANGAIAATAVARSAPDGYTLFMTTPSTHSAAPYLMKSLPFDPIKDFEPVSRMGNLPFILVSAGKLPIKDFRGFVEYGKVNPGKLSYASSNAVGLVGGSVVTRLAGLEMTHVPYKAAPQALQDMLRGEISLMLADYPSALPHVRSGGITALAVTTSERSALLPEIPSMKEVGLPEFDMNSWNAIFVPAGTPASIIERLNSELQAVVADPVVYSRLKEFGFDAFTSTPQELGSFVKDELRKWGSWAREAGLQPE